MRPIDLDQAMITRPFPEVVQVMLPLYDRDWGVPSLPTKRGQKLLSIVEESYRTLLSLVSGTQADLFLFTSSGAEAINQVVESVYKKVTVDRGKNGYLTACTDQAPSILAMDRLQERNCVPKMIPVDRQGRITTQAVAEEITPRTALLSLSWANPLTGVIHPVEEIADLCRERGILFHVDASAVLGKLHVSQEELFADYITFSGEAIHGPLGTGGLWVRDGAPLEPLLVGGPEQGGWRAGALPVPGLVGLAAAVKEIMRQQEYCCTEIARLRNKFEQGIVQRYSEARILFAEQERLPHVSAIAFPGIANEALQYVLNEHNVFCSVGGGVLQQIAIVLQKAGMSRRLSQTALSFSLSLFSSEEEIDEAVERIGSAAHHLRKIGPKQALEGCV